MKLKKFIKRVLTIFACFRCHKIRRWLCDYGFYADRYMEIKTGEVYEVGNEKIIDGEIHLNGVNVNRWIEISKETLER